jgi:hypothetical protein
MPLETDTILISGRRLELLIEDLAIAPHGRTPVEIQLANLVWDYVDLSPKQGSKAWRAKT